MVDTLRLDLRKAIHERLWKWVNDAGELYDMAQLDRNEGIIDAYCSIVQMLISGAVAMNVDTDELVKQIRARIEERKKEIKDVLQSRN